MISRGISLYIIHHHRIRRKQLQIVLIQSLNGIFGIRQITLEGRINRIALYKIILRLGRIAIGEGFADGLDVAGF